MGGGVDGGAGGTGGCIGKYFKGLWGLLKREGLFESLLIAPDTISP